MMMWFITSIRFDKSDKSVYKSEHREAFALEKRTVAFYATKEGAIGAIEKNYGDLNEAGWYPWLVVEGLAANCIYPIVREAEDQIFFEWQGRGDGKWVPCEFPKEVEDYMDKHSYHKQFAEIS